jgi:acylphosphatase
MDDIRIHLIIEGRVQGVWFRDSTRREAVSLGVLGWVRNRPDGTVEVLAEGPEDKVRELITWCNHGPPAAVVSRIHESQDKWQGEFNAFDIIF